MIAFLAFLLAGARAANKALPLDHLTTLYLHDKQFTVADLPVSQLDCVDETGIDGACTHFRYESIECHRKPGTPWTAWACSGVLNAAAKAHGSARFCTFDVREIICSGSTPNSCSLQYSLSLSVDKKCAMAGFAAWSDLFLVIGLLNVTYITIFVLLFSHTSEGRHFMNRCMRSCKRCKEEGEEDEEEVDDVKNSD